MLDFTFKNPTKLIFGKTSMDKIRENIKPFGKKVLLTYGGGSIKTHGIYEKVIKQLKSFQVKEFGGIEPNPRLETLQKCLDQHRDFQPNLILAVGGGSTIDGSKLLASSWHYQGDPWGFLAKRKTQPKKYIPLGVVLTLSATGSEMNGNAVITKWSTNEKLYFSRTETFPKFSILDPQNTFSVPPDQTAYGIVDAYSHVLEQYLHTLETTPLQDRLSEAILLTLIENGPRSLLEPTNYQVRAHLMLSATMALNNIISMGVRQDWATHAIEHELSAFYDIPHGAGLAIITPRWMTATLDQKKSKLAHYGKRIFGLEGTNDQVAEKAIDKTYNLFQSLGIKMSLKDWNITDQHFPTIIKRLSKAQIGEIPLSESQLSQILTESLK
jgi:NADP-dependent alcohol dehydrogenase